MKKLVINTCYGGFSLSVQAMKRMAELKGKPCYFFSFSPLSKTDQYTPLDHEPNGLFWTAFSVPNPNELLAMDKPWHEMSLKERTEHNSLYELIQLDNRPDDRTDRFLVEAV
jgi:hypothetical protein